MAAVVEGTPRKVKALLTSFLHPDASAQTESSPHHQEEGVEKISETMCQPRNKEAFWMRIETFSQFTWFAKPLSLSPLHCAQYGWENTEVDILQCVSCKACLDATLSTSWDLDMYVKTCEHLKEALVSGHSKMCPWPDNPCPDSFAGLPTLSSSEWREDFCLRWHSVLELGDSIPLLDVPTMAGLTEEHLEKLQQLASMSGLPLGPQLPELADEMLRAACLIALCGWQGRNDEHSGLKTLMCSICRREVGLWNFTSKKSAQASAGPEGSESSPSHEGALETLSISQVVSPFGSPPGFPGQERGRRNETSMNISPDRSTEHSPQDPVRGATEERERGSEETAMEQSKDATKDEQDMGAFYRHKTSHASQKESTPMSAGPSAAGAACSRPESRLLGAFVNRSLPDLTDRDNTDSLCVEVEEESLTEKLQAVESELEYMGCTQGLRDDSEPQRKRFKPQEDMEKKPLDVLSEHRTWCPWISVSRDDDRKSDMPGWKLLLTTLLPSLSPDRAHSLLESPPEDAWKGVRKLLSDCYSPALHYRSHTT